MSDPQPRYTVQRSADARPGILVAPFRDEETRRSVDECASWLNRGEYLHDDFSWQRMPIDSPSDCWVIVDNHSAQVPS